MMNSHTVNQRCFSRILFGARVRLVGPLGSIEVRLIDISLKGALVRRPAAWAIEDGMPLELELLLSEADHGRIQMQTTVVHCQSETIGLHCRSIDLDSVSHLHRLIQLNLGDAALLDREIAAMC